MKENSKAGNSAFNARSIPLAILLIIVVLLSGVSGFVGASFFTQQVPNVTTTIYTTTTSWTTSTVWSTVTSVVYGVWTTVQYTTSTSTVTVTSATPSATGTFGTTSNAGTYPGATGNYVVATKYSLNQAGTVTQVSVYASYSGNVKAAIYADKSGTPGNLLVANNAPTAVSAGQWTTITIGPIDLAPGTYWIAFNGDRNNLRVYKNGGTGQAAYVSYAFSKDMPTSWTPSAYQNVDYVCYATYQY